MGSDFPSHWQLFPLEEVMEAIIDYRGKTPTKTSSGIPLITAKIVKDGRIQEPTEFIAEEDYDSWMTRGLPEVGDVVVTSEAPLGEVAQLTDSNIALAQRIVTLRGRKDILDNDYLLCAFQSAYVQNQLESRASGSTVKGIKQSELRKILLPIPPLDEQVEIAKQLKSLSDKIELNRQTNQTLEQIAQAFFKSWFVDFEPTRAKIAAKEAGASPEKIERAAMCAISGKTPDQLAQLPPETQQNLKTTAALFPDALMDSELGEMPEGWEVGIVGDLFELHRGFDLPSTDRHEGEYPVFSASGYHGCHNEFKMEPPGIITGRSGVIGNVYLSLSRYWPLNTTLYVREFKKCGPYYAYFFLSNCDLKSINSGSAVPSLNRNFVHSVPSFLPNDDLLKCFEVSAKKIFAELKALELQSEFLSSLRDTLLPKLLSGEASIS